MAGAIYHEILRFSILPLPQSGESNLNSAQDSHLIAGRFVMK